MRRLHACRIVPAALLLAAGCSIDKPQAPSFETEINVPTGAYHYTVADLIRHSNTVEGDTTGRNPVQIAWRGMIDSVSVGDRLQVDAPGRAVTGRLGNVSIQAPPPVGHAFLFSEFAPFRIPDDTVSVVLPGFAFVPVDADIPPLDGFDEGVLSSGSISMTISNGLPVSVENIHCELVNASDGTPVAAFDFVDPIPPGNESVATASLAGVRIRSALRARLASGNTLDSGGAVQISGDDSLMVEAAFTDLAFETVTCPIGQTTIVAADSVSLGADIIVTEGRISSGILPITLTNTVPLPISVELRLPDVRMGGVEWTHTYDIAAGSLSSPTLLQDDCDLTGADLVPTYGGVGEEYFRHVLLITTNGSGGEPVSLDRTMGATLQSDPFHLSFDSVTASFEPRDTQVTPIRTAFDLPSGTEGLTFTDATLRLVIENGFQIPGELALVVTGARGADSTSIPLSGTILPASGVRSVDTELVWNATNSNILSLVNLHPDEIRVTGRVRVGDGTTVGTVHRTDVLTGRYEIQAPLRVQVSPTEMRPDSFTFSINKDMQDRIRDDIREGEATLTIENHLPIGATVVLTFAGSPQNLRTTPDISLAAVTVDAAECDPVTGEVTRSRTAQTSIALTRDQIPFFARDLVYGQAVINLQSGGAGAVQLMTDDFITVSGILRLRMEVHK